MIGERFGRLVVIAEGPRYVAPGTGKPRRQWKCRCDCGGEALTLAKRLRSGHTKSCGCILRERLHKHGHNTKGKSPTYRSWDSMIGRCHRPGQQPYPRYGGRGIAVCARWRGQGGFENFLADMGPRPDGTTIDRRDGTGDYTPDNCRWASPKQQQRNMRTNHIVFYRGSRVTISEAVESAGITGRSGRAYVYALVNGGMTIDQALARVGGVSSTS